MTRVHACANARISVLLVEDNPLDARMFGRAAARSGFDGTIDAVASGEEALDVLRDSWSDYELVVLDLNLPGLSGLDVLGRLKDDTRTRRTPVIMFSSSCNVADIERSYSAGAAAYLTKPVGTEAYATILGSIGSFWSGVAYPRFDQRAGS